MNTDKTVVVGGNVQGDITSCKIENQVIRVDKNSIWSLQKTTTYASYDVCSKKIISTYKVPEIAGDGVFVIASFIAVILLTISWLGNH